MPQKIADFGFYPQWALDSSHIYFLSLSHFVPNEIPNIVAYSLVDKSHKVIVDKDVLKKAGGRFGIGETGEWQLSPTEDAILVGNRDNELWLIRWR